MLSSMRLIRSLDRFRMPPTFAFTHFVRSCSYTHTYTHASSTFQWPIYFHVLHHALSCLVCMPHTKHADSFGFATLIHSHASAIVLPCCRICVRSRIRHTNAVYLYFDRSVLKHLDFEHQACSHMWSRCCFSGFDRRIHCSKHLATEIIFNTRILFSLF